MRLHELAPPTNTKGTYAGVRFADDTVAAILRYIEAAQLPNSTAADKLHSTLLYSRKFLPDYQPLGEIAPPLAGTPTKLHVWETSPEDPSEPKKRCLVLKYKCDDLVNRHLKLMSDHEATYDFDSFEPHVTLSYDIGDIEIDDLPQFSDYIDAINIVEEYGEELDLNWAKTKGTASE